MEPRISIVTLGVTDLAQARRFYQDGLGFTTAGKEYEDSCFFQLGGLVLWLYPWDKLAEDAHAERSGSGFRGVTLAHNVREKGEVDAILSLAERSGGKIAKPAEEASWGGYSGYFSDPDGHLWEVAWNPFFPLNDRGEIELS